MNRKSNQLMAILRTIGSQGCFPHPVLENLEEASTRGMDGTCAHQESPTWSSYAVVSLAPVADFSALCPAKGPDAQRGRESQ